VKVNGLPIGPSLERKLRQMGLVFGKKELALAIASAQRLGSSTVHLPKGQSFEISETLQSTLPKTASV